MKHPRPNRLTRWLVTTLLFVALFAILSGPASAQDTPQPFPAFSTHTPPDALTVVVSPPADSVSIPTWVLINLNVLLIAAGSVVYVVSRFSASRDLKTTLEHTGKANADAIEAAYEALPDSAQSLIGRGIGIAEGLTSEFTALLKFAREVTDGQPNSEPPPVSSPPMQPDQPPSPAG